MADFADLLRIFYATTPAGAVTGRAPRDDALRGELGSLPRPDGRYSTELSTTLSDPRLLGGRPTNIPLLVKGQTGLASLLADQPPTEEQFEIAIRRSFERLQQGAMLRGYPTTQEAITAAESRPVSAKLPYNRGRW